MVRQISPYLIELCFVLSSQQYEGAAFLLFAEGRLFYLSAVVACFAEIIFPFFDDLSTTRFQNPCNGSQSFIWDF